MNVRGRRVCGTGKNGTEQKQSLPPRTKMRKRNERVARKREKRELILTCSTRLDGLLLVLLICCDGDRLGLGRAYVSRWRRSNVPSK